MAFNAVICKTKVSKFSSNSIWAKIFLWISYIQLIVGTTFMAIVELEVRLLNDDSQSWCLSVITYLTSTLYLILGCIYSVVIWRTYSIVTHIRIYDIHTNLFEHFFMLLRNLQFIVINLKGLLLLTLHVYQFNCFRLLAQISQAPTVLCYS